MATSTTSDLSPGDISPELVPVVEPGALALAFSQPADAGLGSELALGDLLSDALFGEVIDISDLIPRLLSPSGEAVTPQVPPAETMAAQELGLPDGADILAAQGHAAVLTIFYDEDLLAANAVL